MKYMKFTNDRTACTCLFYLGNQLPTWNQWNNQKLLYLYWSFVQTQAILLRYAIPDRSLLLSDGCWLRRVDRVEEFSPKKATEQEPEQEESYADLSLFHQTTFPEWILLSPYCRGNSCKREVEWCIWKQKSDRKFEIWTPGVKDRLSPYSVMPHPRTWVFFSGLFCSLSKYS